MVWGKGLHKLKYTDKTNQWIRQTNEYQKWSENAAVQYTVFKIKTIKI